MATINTNDGYVKEYLEEHQEAKSFFNEIIELKENFLTKYGVPQKGGIEYILFDINQKDWLKKVKETQIDLLHELKRVCDEHGLKIFLIYGSLLGAVRSGGMLPDDDDIDVALLREDYDKLISLTGEFKEPYFLQNNYNDDCFYGGYIKLRNTQTTAINPQNWYVNCCEGIFIDIFPIDKTFSSSAKEKFKLKKIFHLQRLLFAKSYGFFRNFRDMPLFVWKAYKYFGKLFSRETLLKKLDDVFKSHDDGKKKFPDAKEKLAIYAHYRKKISPEYFAESDFVDLCQMTFEGLQFFAPKNWDEMLYKFYGYGYLQPSIHKQEFHCFYKTDVSYEKYKTRFTKLFTSVPDKNKKIIVVGDEVLYDEYKKRFPSAKYKAHSFISFDVISKLKEFSLDEVFLVIAAFDFLEVEKSVREFGYRDYCIYVYDRQWMLLPDLRTSRIRYENINVT